MVATHRPRLSSRRVALLRLIEAAIGAHIGADVARLQTVSTDDELVAYLLASALRLPLVLVAVWLWATLARLRHPA